jgi:hypothetical protein
MKKKKEKKDNTSIKVNDKISDFDIVIDSFGKIHANYDVDKINDFLNQNTNDKKLKNKE